MFVQVTRLQHSLFGFVVLEPVGFDQVGASLADHDGRCVGVATDDVGRNGTVDDAQAFDSVDAQFRVDDGRLVPGRAHFARSGRVVDGGRVVADETGPVRIRPQR